MNKKQIFNNRGELRGKRTVSPVLICTSFHSIILKQIYCFYKENNMSKKPWEEKVSDEELEDVVDADFEEVNGDDK